MKHNTQSMNWKLFSASIDILLIFSLVASLQSVEYVWAFASIFGIFLKKIPILIGKYLHINPMWELLVSVPILFHVVGGILGLYVKIPWWDVLTHFMSSVTVCLFAVYCMIVVDAYFAEISFTMPIVIIFVVMISLAGGALWEIGEYISDKIFGTHEQKGLDDTMKDLIVDLLGGLAVSLGAAYIIKKRGGYENIIKKVVNVENSVGDSLRRNRN